MVVVRKRKGLEMERKEEFDRGKKGRLTTGRIGFRGREVIG